ncbi:MAG: integrins alpha chain [Planctomycetota bacterium]|nr:integrins alpha chain [Planctomycetota bacterium]
MPDVRRRTDKGQPTFSDSDTYLYHGEELVRLSDGTYRAENEGTFHRLRPLPGGGWEAREKNGRVLRFGLYSNAIAQGRSSRETGPAPDLRSTDFDRTSRWLLDEVVDLHGNLIEYEYTRLAHSPGRLYLDGVRYGLRADDPPARRRARPHFAIRLDYESRDDALSDYRTGYESRLGGRCKAVRVLAYPPPETEPDGRLIRQYGLDYDARPAAGPSPDLIALSRLYAIEQRDGQGNPLPPIGSVTTTFNYHPRTARPVSLASWACPTSVPRSPRAMWSLRMSMPTGCPT